MIPDLRREKILCSVKKTGISYIKNLSNELGISLSTVRRDIAVLEQEGTIIVMRGGAVRYRGKNSVNPLKNPQLAHGREKDAIAQKGASFVEDGDYIYVDSGSTTMDMLKYLQGKKITLVSGGTQLLENLPVKGAKSIILGGEIRVGSMSFLGAFTEKMITDLYFDKAFLSADGYVPGGGIYSYDDQEARKKVLIKEHTNTVYVLMDTSKKNKYAFSKVFDLEEVNLIAEEDC